MSKGVFEKIDAWRTRGAIAPSSKFLVRRMIDKIDYAQDLDLLQFGFGTGIFTRGLLKRMSPGSALTVFEVNPACRDVSLIDDRLAYIEDSAENVSVRFGDKRFDHIVSTLPFASLPKEVCENIFDQIRLHLKENGKFLQFQYSLFSKDDISNLFDCEPDIDFEFFNIPPAFIYETVNRKTDAA